MLHFVGWVIIITFTSIAGLAVGVGLLQMAKAVQQQEWERQDGTFATSKSHMKERSDSILTPKRIAIAVELWQ